MDNDPSSGLFFQGDFEYDTDFRPKHTEKSKKTIFSAYVEWIFTQIFLFQFLIETRGLAVFFKDENEYHVGFSIRGYLTLKKQLSC